MPLTVTDELCVDCCLAREPTCPGHARERAREALAGWGLGEHAGLAELVVSELVTNALCHGEGPVRVRLSYAAGDLQVEVHDDGDRRPVRRQPADADECGRGLALLDCMIEMHGGEWAFVDDHAGPGKTVYVVLTLPADPDVT